MSDSIELITSTGLALSAPWCRRSDCRVLQRNDAPAFVSPFNDCRDHAKAGWEWTTITVEGTAQFYDRMDDCQVGPEGSYHHLFLYETALSEDGGMPLRQRLLDRAPLSKPVPEHVNEVGVTRKKARKGVHVMLIPGIHESVHD